MFIGQIVRKNAVENNLLYSEVVEGNKYKVTEDNFGPRWLDPATGKYSKTYKEGFIRRDRDHFGTDITSPEGVKIYSAADGVVTRNYTSDSYGNTIVIQSTTSEEEKVWSLYAHMPELQ
jgi:murein DD-endopeptidase MepM/ murein hydrolase activator NlpD